MASRSNSHSTVPSSAFPISGIGQVCRSDAAINGCPREPTPKRESPRQDLPESIRGPVRLFRTARIPPASATRFRHRLQRRRRVCAQRAIAGPYTNQPRHAPGRRTDVVAPGGRRTDTRMIPDGASRAPGGDHAVDLTLWLPDPGSRAVPRDTTLTPGMRPQASYGSWRGRAGAGRWPRRPRGPVPAEQSSRCRRW
jgi:hypothetical protein